MIGGKRTILSSAVALGLFLGGAGVSNAQDQPITRTELLRVELEGVEGKEGVVFVTALAPGAVGGKHTHPGDEFVYVLNGVIVVVADGKAPVTLKQGEAVYQAPGVVHFGKNDSNDEAAKVLVFLVAEKGKPLAEPVE